MSKIIKEKRKNFHIYNSYILYQIAARQEMKSNVVLFQCFIGREFARCCTISIKFNNNIQLTTNNPDVIKYLCQKRIIGALNHVPNNTWKWKTIYSVFFIFGTKRIAARYVYQKLHRHCSISSRLSRLVW